MVSVLHLVAYFGCALAFCIVTLSLACGLYYLAELVEEYTVLTKKIIKNITGVVCAIHVLLWLFDGFPTTRIFFSLACHGIYSLNLKTFPFITLTSIPFAASCVLVLVDHFVWFSYFSSNAGYRLMDIAAFFGLCVWLVPFSYFISLSAADHVLPNYDPSMISANGDQKRTRTGLLKKILEFFWQKKEDLVLFPSWSGSMDLCLDVAIVSPFATNGGVGPGSAVRRAEERKIEKYKARCQERGMAFLPFVLSIFGGFGPGTSGVLERMAVALSDVQRADARETLQSIIQRISFAGQRALAEGFLMRSET